MQACGVSSVKIGTDGSIKGRLTGKLLLFEYVEWYCYFYYARRLGDDVYQLPTTFCGHLQISFSLGVAFKKAFGSYTSRRRLR